MAVTGENTLDQLRAGDPSALAGNTSPLIEELRGLLTPENIEEGVWIQLGADREALQEIITAMGLDEMARNNGPLRILQPAVHESGFSSFIAKDIDALRKLSLVDALDAMQMERWNTQPGYLSLTDMKPPLGSVRSTIIMGYASEDSEKHVDITLPLVLLSARYHYGARLLEDNGEPAAYTSIGELMKKYGDRKEGRMGAFATHMANNGYTLAMPERSYIFAIGSPASEYISVASVKTNKDYQLVRGHFQEL